MSAMFVNSQPLPREHIERFEAAGGGRVLAGAESEAGVDLERSGSGRDAAAVGRGVDEEAAGTDRLEPGLAHRHPVGLAELLDLRSAAAQPGDLGQILGGRLMIEIGMDQPLVGPRLVGLVGDQHRRIGRLGTARAPRSPRPARACRAR